MIYQKEELNVIYLSCDTDLILVGIDFFLSLRELL